MLLTDREKIILEALVELYVRDAGPVSSGWASIIRATAPATKGVEKEVPEANSQRFRQSVRIHSPGASTKRALASPARLDHWAISPA